MEKGIMVGSQNSGKASVSGVCRQRSLKEAEAGEVGYGVIPSQDHEGHVKDVCVYPQSRILRSHFCLKNSSCERRVDRPEWVYENPLSYCKCHFSAFSVIKWCPYFTIFVLCIWDLHDGSLSFHLPCEGP